ncbi:hypothetical protein [Leifsonia sp. SIMBA_070]|uniref:hypothetical protein n=1 Tax=Leifsonia sp. SIMBA_070 TaxID=3085810 RepID=UPI003978F1EE
MSIQTLANAVLIVLLIGWVGYRQLTWRPVVVSRMWRFPAILAVVGVVLIGQQTKPAQVTPLDLAVIAGELLLSLAIGAWMGAIAHFRRLPEPIAAGRRPGEVAVYESQTGVLGLVLWVVVVAVRIGVDVLATQAGAHLVAATGVILLVFAANRIARTAVFAARLDRHAAALTSTGA